MKSNLAASQKIGWVVFAIGAAYMLGLGWLRSWWMVPAANQVGSDAYSDLLGFLWQLSVPLGAYIVAMGAALVARVERSIYMLLILLLVLTIGWNIFNTIDTVVPALFGAGGGLITFFFIGSTWQWARNRPVLSGAVKTGSDLRMVGTIFFVVAAWTLCGIFGIGNFVLRPELADKFSIPIGRTINTASTVMVLLVLGWGFTYFGQLISRQVVDVVPEVDQVPQTAAAD